MKIRVYNEETSELNYYEDVIKTLSKRNVEIFIANKEGRRVFFNCNQANLYTERVDAAYTEIYTGDIISMFDHFDNEGKVIFIYNDQPSVLHNGAVIPLSELSMSSAYVESNIYEDITAKIIFEDEFEAYKQKNYTSHSLVVGSYSKSYKELGPVSYAGLLGQRGSKPQWFSGMLQISSPNAGLLTAITEGLRKIPRGNMIKINVYTTSDFVVKMINYGNIHVWYHSNWIKKGPEFGEVKDRAQWEALREELLGRQVEFQTLDYSHSGYQKLSNYMKGVMAEING